MRISTNLRIASLIDLEIQNNLDSAALSMACSFGMFSMTAYWKVFQMAGQLKWFCYRVLWFSDKQKSQILGERQAQIDADLV